MLPFFKLQSSSILCFSDFDLCLLIVMSLSALTAEKYIGVVSIGMGTKIQRMQQYEQRSNMFGLV